MPVENSFEVGARADRAWALLDDVPRVAQCMPAPADRERRSTTMREGARARDARPVPLRFDADVLREVEGAAAPRVVLATKARELRGRGAAQARIESSLSDAAGRTKVDIVTELSLQGAVAQYGRGIVPGVAPQLAKQFADNVATLLEREESPAPAAGPALPRAQRVHAISGSGSRCGRSAHGSRVSCGG